MLYIVKRHIDPHEHDAVQLSCSRLQPVSCRWGECDIVLNSVDTLIHHLNREHKPDGLVSFLWKNVKRSPSLDSLLFVDGHNAEGNADLRKSTLRSMQ